MKRNFVYRTPVEGWHREKQVRQRGPYRATISSAPPCKFPDCYSNRVLATINERDALRAQLAESEARSNRLESALRFVVGLKGGSFGALAQAVERCEAALAAKEGK